MTALSRTCCAAVRRQVAKDGSIAALARRAEVPYALVRRVYHANARRDHLYTADAYKVNRLLLACGRQLVLTKPGMPTLPLGV